MLVTCRLIFLVLTCAAAQAAQTKAEPPQKPLPVDAGTARALTKLGREWVMLGIGDTDEHWFADTRQHNQACWDLRYQYLVGGVNTGSSWASWNQPAGAYLTMFLTGTDKLGAIPFCTYYQMVHSKPGRGQGGEDKINRINSGNAETMRAYLADIKLFMQKAGAFAKPVIFHWEPDLSGYLEFSKEFSPNDPDRIVMPVQTTGFEEAKGCADTPAGLCKAISILRDRYAPNVLLGFDIARWGNPSPQTSVQFFTKMVGQGAWDLIIISLSDRDSGFKVAHHYMDTGSWWTDADFTSSREWCAGLHQLTGMPILLWQLPMGNTVMASCDNTEHHFMDNRPEYWLENYPANQHIREWAQAGIIGLTFGGGAGGCTDVGDAAKDGVTNPAPVENNRGEKSQYADDDGGYLRIRGGNYYQKGVLRLAGNGKPKTKSP